MKYRKCNLECAIGGCSGTARVVATTTCSNGDVRRRCECDCSRKHRFTLYGNVATPVRKSARYEGAILTDWRPYPFTDVATLQRAAI